MATLTNTLIAFIRIPALHDCLNDHKETSMHQLQLTECAIRRNIVFA
ncbi:hypothetical protein T01_1379 [Trichinella spiralis]|uniref:Uncharacterized protein n=1 Tax=Trichinella spiralis TaxID=6334 RepID=A0A0V0ZXS3_TRISP|nr:hypothetical protein T01_1379 [Trichinella spiralis]